MRGMRNTPVWFNVGQAAHVVTWLTLKSGGHLDRMRAMMLAYIAQRESIATYGHPLVDDDFQLSMYGPISTYMYDLTYRYASSLQWDIYLVPGARRILQVQDGIDYSLLDELSVANINVLDAIWDKFGALDTDRIYSWIREYCTEWKSGTPEKTPLPLARIMAAVGIEDPEEAARDEMEQRGVTTTFRTLTA